jgi:hypothetical protein
MKNWHATKNYCSKGETRTGSIYTNIPGFSDLRHSGTPKIVEKKNYVHPSPEEIRKIVAESVAEGFDICEELWMGGPFLNPSWCVD